MVLHTLRDIIEFMGFWILLHKIKFLNYLLVVIVILIAASSAWDYYKHVVCFATPLKAKKHKKKQTNTGAIQ